ncbi:MAG: hypothetical protein C0598_14320 [Marinilabiliales bacterium]|nr:MAG: hypothetical protein C0598_14320 [Marinilabiliales bacterium]
MKKLLLSILIFMSISLFSQNDTIKNWTIKGKASLNFSQSYFSNWSAGGENSITAVGKYTMNADYKKDKKSWTNWLDLALGYSIIGKADPMKTEDKIEFISAYDYTFKKHWSISAVLTFKSQFAKGYDYANDSSNHISGFMAPAYIDLGPGISYKPNKHFSVNISPATPRFIVVMDQDLANKGSFGLTPADTVNNVVQNAKQYKAAFGAKLLMTLGYDIAKNVNLSTKLEMFSDYLDNPQNIDVNWQTMIALKVNSWLNVNISTELIYDDDVIIKDANDNPLGPRTQFKQMLMVGIGYSF